MWSVCTNSLNSIREWFYYCMFYNNTYSDLAGNHLIFQTPRNLVFNKTLLTENQMYRRPRPSCSNFSTWLFLLEKSFAYFFSISIHKNIWASFTHRLLFFKFIPRGVHISQNLSVCYRIYTSHSSTNICFLSFFSLLYIYLTIICLFC